MTRRGIRLATASVVPTTENPAFEHRAGAHEGHGGVLICPVRPTGCASTAGAPAAAA